MEIDAAPSVGAVTLRRRGMRSRLLVTAVIVAVLAGAGLRFIPTNAAAATGSTGAASTACAAT